MYEFYSGYFCRVVRQIRPIVRGLLVPFCTLRDNKNPFITSSTNTTVFPSAAETVLAALPGLLPPGKWWEHPDLNGDSFGYEPTALTNYAMFP